MVFLDIGVVRPVTPKAKKSVPEFDFEQPDEAVLCFSFWFADLTHR
jgi:hypothetical protein